MNMGKQSKYALPADFSQHGELSIRLVSPGFGHLSEEAARNYTVNNRPPYYFFLFIFDGAGQYDLDTEKLNLGRHELLFAVPSQLREYPAALHGKDYYKLGFDDECLSRLPGKFPFLLDPLNQQKISFLPAAANRLRAGFEMLLDLLRTADSDPELILAYLNSLLTEINTAYFISQKKPAAGRLQKFIGFKLFVENNLTSQPAITDIAAELALSTDGLYRIVKEYAGVSPKEFITGRLITEARRRICQGQDASVKELAYELGFNDPSYFSRLFKKVTGKTIAGFSQDLSS